MRIKLDNPTIEQVDAALDTVQKRTRTGRLHLNDYKAAVGFLSRTAELGSMELDIRGGEPVAHAYNYPHAASGITVTRDQNGQITVEVERDTGNDSSAWAIVRTTVETQAVLRAANLIDQWCRIPYRPD